MPFFSLTGHRLTRTHWTVRGTTTPFSNEDQIFDQLKGCQNARCTRLVPLELSASGGVLSAQFRYAVALRESPRYIEYCCLNENGTPAFLLNAIIGFSLSPDTHKGCVLITHAAT